MIVIKSQYSIEADIACDGDDDSQNNNEQRIGE